MKTIKFFKKLVPLIENGEKTATWRLFDDKDLQTGDRVQFITTETLEPFGTATLTEV